MRIFISLLSVIVLAFYMMYPVPGYTQEATTGQVIGGIAGEILADKAGFTDKEKEIIRRYYRGPKAEDDDWRNAENNLSNYHWNTRTGDDESEVAKKKKNQKKKGGKNMPPGLAKKDELPPGLQKQLEKNGTLPPGLAKRNLPNDLASQLPRRANTQERVVIEEDIVLIEKTTGIILDILYGGARRQ